MLPSSSEQKAEWAVSQWKWQWCIGQGIDVLAGTLGMKVRIYADVKEMDGVATLYPSINDAVLSLEMQ